MSESRRKGVSAISESVHHKDGAKHDGGYEVEENEEKSADSEPDFVTKAATIGIIGVGVALIEVSLIPGMLIGLAAAFLPKYAPKIGEGLKPLVKSTVRGTIKVVNKTREAIAEASEQVQDMVAEAKLEDMEESADARSSEAAKN